MKKTTTTNNNIVAVAYETTCQEGIKNYDKINVEIAHALEDRNVTYKKFQKGENKMIKEMSKKMVKVYGLQNSVISEDNGICKVEVTVNPIAKVVDGMPAIITSTVESEGRTNLRFDYAEPVVVTKCNFKRQVSKVYNYVGDPAVLARYIERNKLDTCMFQPMTKLAQSQNLIYIGSWNEVKVVISMRLAFQGYRRNYSCYWLDQESHMHAVDYSLVAEQNQLANKENNKATVSVTYSAVSHKFMDIPEIQELKQWVKLYMELNNINRSVNEVVMMLIGTAKKRESAIDAMNAFISEVAPNYDRYTQGHIEMADKHNYFKTTSSHQNENGKEYCSTADKTKTIYVTGLIDLLKDYCTVSYCNANGVDLDDTVGNPGRVSRECIESGVITYSELAELINASEDREYYIELLQNGASIEDIASFFDLTVEESASSEYREF